MPYSHYPATKVRLPSAKYVSRKSNAIFALSGHESTSSVSRKSNAIFALPGHGSTSLVGHKSNAIFALPGHETSYKARKDDERHQESRQDRPDQIMLQHYVQQIFQ
nr:hypothetical protein [Tanacetum cinerariifolium]